MQFAEPLSNSSVVNEAGISSAFFKIAFSGGAWKEGLFVYKGAFQTAFYYLWLGHYISKLKKQRKNL